MYERQLNALYNLALCENNDSLEQALQSVDLTTIGESILSQVPMDNMTEEESLMKILNVAQYIETDTPLESPISDELYDKLHARYVELTGHGIVGTNQTSGSNKPLKEHLYPELRGSLDKVHFIYNEQIPQKDSRRSFQQWLEGVYNKCGLDKETKYINISYSLKYDGLSAVFECTDDHIDCILTRKDVDKNVGVNITHILPSSRSVKDIFPQLEEFWVRGLHGKYGIKCEIFMFLDKFEEFCKIVPIPPKNHRSAVSMILNTSASEYNPEWFNYLTIQPLQLSCENKIGDYPPDKEKYKYLKSIVRSIGVSENGRYQYLATPVEMIACENPPGMYGELERDMIPAIKDYAEEAQIPIDGVVCTIRDEEYIQMLGRKDNINQYQIAYKFPAGIKKTKLISVEFLVGPVAGTITPVAHVEPIKIMGNIIDSPSLSNLAKLERLDLNVGDEVMIKYDIVPTLFKDETCIKGTGVHIDTIETCPLCNEKLEITEDKAQARCINPDCPAKMSGKIYNFARKMKIPELGLATIEFLVEKKFLQSPADLYGLINHKDELVQLPGFGEKSVDTLVNTIMSHRSAYAHDLFGSLGIPDIGRRIMKKIADDGSVSFMELLDAEDETVIGRLSKIKGIGEPTAIKICSGILNNKVLIEDLLHYIEIIPYDKTEEYAETVLFTKVRDPEFAEYLESSKQANVSGGYNKSVTIVIVPDKNTTSDKVTKAKKDGKTILTLAEAHQRFGYAK